MTQLNRARHGTAGRGTSRVVCREEFMWAGGCFGWRGVVDPARRAAAVPGRALFLRLDGLVGRRDVAHTRAREIAQLSDVVDVARHRVDQLAVQPPGTTNHSRGELIEGRGQTLVGRSDTTPHGSRRITVVSAVSVRRVAILPAVVSPTPTRPAAESSQGAARPGTARPRPARKCACWK